MLAVVAFVALACSLVLGILVSSENLLALLAVLVGFFLFPVALVVTVLSAGLAALSGQAPVLGGWATFLGMFVDGAFGFPGWYYVAGAAPLWVASAFVFDGESDTDSSSEGEPEALLSLGGVDGETAQSLREAGYDTVSDVAGSSRSDLADVVGDALAARIKADLGGGEAADDFEADTVEDGDTSDTGTAPTTAPDSTDRTRSESDTGPSEAAGLVDVSGVGHSRAETLAEAGYESVGDLRDAGQEELSDVVGTALAARIKVDVGDSVTDGHENGDSDRSSPDDGPDGPENGTGTREADSRTSDEEHTTERLSTLQTDLKTRLETAVTDPFEDPEATQEQLERARTQCASLIEAAEGCDDQKTLEVARETRTEIETRLDALPDITDALDVARSRVPPGTGPSTSDSEQTLRLARRYYDEAIEIAEQAGFDTDPLHDERRAVVAELERRARDEGATAGQSDGSAIDETEADVPHREELVAELQTLDEEWADVSRKLLYSVSDYRPDDFVEEFGSLDEGLAVAREETSDQSDDEPIEPEDRHHDETGETDSMRGTDSTDDGLRATLIAELQGLDEEWSDIDRRLLYSVGEHHPDDYEEAFGSLDEALVVAGVREPESSSSETSDDASNDEEPNQSVQAPASSSASTGSGRESVYTRDDVLLEINDVIDVLGRQPKTTEFKGVAEMSLTPVYQHFDGWQEALEAAEDWDGFDAGATDGTSRGDESAREASESTPSAKRGRKREYTESDVLAAISALEETLGRRPKTTDFKRDAPMSLSVVYDNFDGWGDAVAAARDVAADSRPEETDKRVEARRADLASQLAEAESDSFADLDRTRERLEDARKTAAELRQVASEHGRDRVVEYAEEKQSDVGSKLSELAAIETLLDEARSRVPPDLGPSPSLPDRSLHRAREIYDEAIGSAVEAGFDADELEAERQSVVDETERRERDEGSVTSTGDTGGESGDTGQDGSGRLFAAIDGITEDERLSQPLAVKVEEVTDSGGDRVQTKLLVTDLAGTRCRMNVWRKHGIDISWEPGHWYVLRQVRGKYWVDKHDRENRQLSSTRDMRVSHVGRERPDGRAIDPATSSDEEGTPDRSSAGSQKQPTSVGSGSVGDESADSALHADADSEPSDDRDDDDDVERDDSGILDDVIGEFEDLSGQEESE